MRDSILRVVDDLETKLEHGARKLERETDKVPGKVAFGQNMFASGAASGLEYAIQELKKVLTDGKS